VGDGAELSMIIFSERWTVNWELRIENWELRIENWGWRVNGEQWTVNSEQWTVNNGQWRVGELRIENWRRRCYLPQINANGRSQMHTNGFVIYNLQCTMYNGVNWKLKSENWKLRMKGKWWTVNNESLNPLNTLNFLDPLIPFKSPAPHVRIFVSLCLC